VRRGSLLLAGFLCGCGSDPPGTVDTETIALDVGACARGEPSCTTSGPVVPAEVLAPGTNDAITLRTGGRISGQLARPYDGRLVWLAIGVRSFGDALLEVQVGDRPPTQLRPLYGFTRVEIDMGAMKPAPGALVSIREVEGAADLTWVVGRWSP
jgi:hypothetical protein